MWRERWLLEGEVPIGGMASQLGALIQQAIQHRMTLGRLTGQIYNVQRYLGLDLRDKNRLVLPWSSLVLIEVVLGRSAV